MSSIQSSSEISPIFHSLRDRLLCYLPTSSERAQVIFESSALVQVSYATIINIPFAFFSKEMGTSDLTHMLRSRLVYVEAGLMSLANFVCKVALGTLYTTLFLVTLGLSDSVNFSTRMHWHHATYAISAAGISLIGAVSPYYGAGLNLLLLKATVHMMGKCYGHDLHLFERPLLNEVKGVCRTYSKIVYNYTREKVRIDSCYYREYKPSLEYIERKIHEAQRMDDLINLIFKVRDEWPRVGLAGHPEVGGTSLDNQQSRAIHSYYV